MGPLPHGTDWRHAELVRDAGAARASVERWDRWISELDAMLVTARAAEAEFRDDLLRLRDQAAELRRTTPTDRMWIDQDGLPRTGAPPSAIRRHEEIMAALAERETEFNRWIGERTIRLIDAGGVDRSWSPRRLTDVEQQLGEARRGRAFAGVALEKLEAQLTPGERVQSGEVAPDYAEHRQRVQRLHQRPG